MKMTSSWLRHMASKLNKGMLSLKVFEHIKRLNLENEKYRKESKSKIYQEKGSKIQRNIVIWLLQKPITKTSHAKLSTKFDEKLYSSYIQCSLPRQIKNTKILNRQDKFQYKIEDGNVVFHCLFVGKCLLQHSKKVKIWNILTLLISTFLQQQGWTFINEFIEFL